MRHVSRTSADDTEVPPETVAVHLGIATTPEPIRTVANPSETCRSAGLGGVERCRRVDFPKGGCEPVPARLRPRRSSALIPGLPLPPHLDNSRGSHGKGNRRRDPLRLLLSAHTRTSPTGARVRVAKHGRRPATGRRPGLGGHQDWQQVTPPLRVHAGADQVRHRVASGSTARSRGGRTHLFEDAVLAMSSRRWRQTGRDRCQ